jgi:hypothetical protein
MLQGRIIRQTRVLGQDGQDRKPVQDIHKKDNWKKYS